MLPVAPLCGSSPFPLAARAETALLSRQPCGGAAGPLARRHRLPHLSALEDQLERFISVAYQASLLFEEGQPVRYRLLLAAAEALPPAADGNGPYRLALAVPHSYEEQEIRRLSPALHAPGSLLAVRPDAAAGLLIWAVLRSRQPPREDEAPWPAPQRATRPAGGGCRIA